MPFDAWTLAHQSSGYYKGGQPTPFVNAFDQVTVGSLRYNTSQMGTPLPLCYGTQRIQVNFLEFWGYQTTSGKGGKGGGGGSKGKSKAQPTSSVYVALGICQGPVSFTGSTYGSGGNNRIWANAGIGYGPGSVGLNAFAGNDGQAADPTFEASDPNRPVLGYSGTCYCTGDPLQLGESTAVPNVSFEITGFGTRTGQAAFPNDANGAYIITDMLTNSRYGAGFPSANIDTSGTFADLETYCLATGMMTSLLLDRCQAAAQWVDYLCERFVAAPFWSGALLKIVPYALVAYSGNGVSWTPNLTPQYSVDDRDLLDWGGDSDPVIVTRADPTQATNWFGVEYYDIDNSYNPNIAYAFDQGAIDQYGLRNEPTTEGHCFTNSTSAQASAQMQLQRKQLILNKYKFKLGWVFCLLDPMDVIEITDLGAGLNQTPVRITSISEDDNNELEFEAEAMPGVASATPAFNFTIPSSQTPGINEDPGPVNTPILFGMPIPLAANQGLALGIALSGENVDAWGGCWVYVSTDGTTYARCPSAQIGPSRMGILTAEFPVTVDPDTTTSLQVNLSESGGDLLSGTTTDADQDVTLCVVGTTSAGIFECISYSTATLESQGQYTLSDYIRRGQYSTSILDHANGSAFARVDGSIYQIPYQADQIGQTMYLKFVSFNAFASNPENIADVTAYEVVLPAPPNPPNVQNFNATQTGTAVTFAWDAVNYPTVGLAGYNLGYAPQGTTNWADFTMILEASNMTTHTNADVPPGTWTFGIRAANLAYVPGSGSDTGLSPQAAFVNLIVTNPNEVIYDTDEAATRIASDQSSTIVSPTLFWGGTLSNFVLHYTGVLLPNGTKTLTNYAPNSGLMSGTVLWTNIFQDPVASATYTTGAIDTGYNADLRAYSNITCELLPGNTGAVAAPTLYIDTWLTGQTDPNTFTEWTFGYVEMRYIRFRLGYAPASGNVSLVAHFVPEIDTAPTVTTADGVVIAAGGTAVTFPQEFHIAPYVVATPQSSSALYATVTDITTSGCTIHVWNASGTDVGGTVNYSATGE